MFETIKKYLSPFPKQKKVALKGFSVYLSHVLGDLVSVFFLAKITQLLELGNTERLFFVLGIYLGVVICFNVFFYIGRNRTRTDISPAYRKTLQSIYIPKFIALDTTYVEKVGTGKIISIIKEGTYQRARSLDSILNVGTQVVVTILYLIVSFWSVGYVYMVGFIVILLACFYFARYCNAKIIEARTMRINASHGHSKQLVKIIMSKNEIMQSQKAVLETNNLNAFNDEYIKYSRRTNPWIHWFYFVPGILFQFGRIGLFGYAGWVVITSGGGISDIILLGGGLLYLDQTISSALTFYKDLTRDFDYVKKMRDFFEEGKTDYDINEGSDFTYTGGDIVFQNTSFGYNDTNVLDGLHLTIQGKHKTALVGASGAGKSTIVKLIAGYIRPDSGTILVDGQDLTEVSLKSYYKHIGYLTQEPSVFDGTIRENLTYAVDQKEESQSSFLRRQESSESPSQKDSSIARPSLTVNDKIEEAIRLSKCEFIYEFPDGLDTEIGERGIRLSGGQRQRLAIAKIFLKNPKIIILDEPTSALDSFSEEAITQAMNELFKNRTVIIIAHRLQTVKHADEIILLDHGNVAERGTHDELVNLGGQYAKMLELQSGF